MSTEDKLVEQMKNVSQQEKDDDIRKARTLGYGSVATIKQEKELLSAWKAAKQFSEEADAEEQKQSAGLDYPPAVIRQKEQEERDRATVLQISLLESWRKASQRKAEADEAAALYRKQKAAQDRKNTVRNILLLIIVGVVGMAMYNTNIFGLLDGMTKPQESAQGNTQDQGTAAMNEDAKVDIEAGRIEDYDLSGYQPIKMSATASSSLPKFPASNAADMNVATCWEERGLEAQTITFDMGETYAVQYISFKLGRWNNDDPSDTDAYTNNCRPRILTLQVDDYKPLNILFDDEKTEWILDIGAAVEFSSFSLSLTDIYPGEKWAEDVCITEITAYEYVGTPSAEADEKPVEEEQPAEEQPVEEEQPVDDSPDPVEEEPAVVAAKDKEYAYTVVFLSPGQDLSWDEAEERCEQQGGTLAAIRTQSDLDEIYKQMGSLPSGVKSFYLYIGGKRDTKDGSETKATPYWWVDGGRQDLVNNEEDSPVMQNLWMLPEGSSKYEPSYYEPIGGEDLPQTVLALVYYQGRWVVDDLEANFPDVISGLTGGNHDSYRIGYIMEREI